jgi:hypothetical protein
MNQMTEKEYIAMLMKNLHCSEEAARDVMITDRAINQGADPFPLTAEQKEVEKQMRQADRKKETAPRQRERKADADKKYLIEAIEEMLSCSDVQAEDVTITNPERQIDFTFRDKKYRIVLSAPRK